MWREGKGREGKQNVERRFIKIFKNEREDEDESEREWNK